MKKYNIKELEEKLKTCKDIDLSEVNIDEVDDLNEIRIGRRKSKEEKIIDFISKTKNPYIFKVGGIMRLTKRFIVESLDNIPLSSPMRYERYYINDKLRIQKKDNYYEKEILDDQNVLIEKSVITEEEFGKLKSNAYSKIVRDSYLYLKNHNISIKKYYGDYEGLNRVEVKFTLKEEMDLYNKEPWMGEEITFSPLAFDKDLSKLNREEFLKELKKYL